MLMHTIDAVSLRLDRASQHLLEVERLITDYHIREPYSAVQTFDSATSEYVYRLQFDGEPDRQIAVIIGDHLHNVRSALNYLMEGLVPHRRLGRTQFPIFVKDPFARDPLNPRKFLVRDPYQRRTWNGHVEGVDPRAVDCIRELQPYSTGTKPERVNFLYALNRLSNADKHQKLVVVPQGLEDPERVVGMPGDPVTVFGWPDFLEEGTEVFRSPTPKSVYVRGNVLLLIKVGEPRIRVSSLHDALIWVRAFVVDPLTPYLRR